MVPMTRPDLDAEGLDAQKWAELRAMVAPLKWVDLFGIDPDYCGGMDVSEYLDESRGEA